MEDLETHSLVRNRAEEVSSVQLKLLRLVDILKKKYPNITYRQNMENNVLSFNLEVDISSNHHITAGGKMSRQRRRKRRSEMCLMERESQGNPEHTHRNGLSTMPNDDDHSKYRHDISHVPDDPPISPFPAGQIFRGHANIPLHRSATQHLESLSRAKIPMDLL